MKIEAMKEIQIFMDKTIHLPMVGIKFRAFQDRNLPIRFSHSNKYHIHLLLIYLTGLNCELKSSRVFVLLRSFSKWRNKTKFDWHVHFLNARKSIRTKIVKIKRNLKFCAARVCEKASSFLAPKWLWLWECEKIYVNKVWNEKLPRLFANSGSLRVQDGESSQKRFVLIF